MNNYSSLQSQEEVSQPEIEWRETHSFGYAFALVWAEFLVLFILLSSALDP